MCSCSPSQPSPTTGGRGQEDESLVAIAHGIRTSLVPPHLSLFRVVCILQYQDSKSGVHLITGTNAESSYIGSSICAERSAMCKLREAVDVVRVTKVVVVTDSDRALAPGILCREFLSTHLPPSTPVIMAGSSKGPNHCKVSWEVNETLSPSPESSNMRSSFGVGEDQQNTSWCLERCLVGDLYPFPNLYGTVTRNEQLRLGFMTQQASEDLLQEGKLDALGLEKGIATAYERAQIATSEDDRDALHPIRYAAAVVFSDGHIEVAHEMKALEYGGSLDPMTLLAPLMMQKRKEGVNPSCLMQVDQFGNLHAPFGQARTFLTEHGFKEAKVMVHDRVGQLRVIKAEDLVPQVIAGGDLSPVDLGK